MTTLLSEGAELFYTVDGPQDARDVLLLVHGWCCDSHDWSWQLPEFSRDHLVVAFDLRGHGRSSAPPGSYAPQLLARDAAAVLKAAAPGRRAVVIGHSMGAAIASMLAVQDPDLVRGLILLDPGYGMAVDAAAALASALGGPDPHGVAQAVFDGFYTDGTPAPLRTWHRRRLLGTPRHVLVESLRSIIDGDTAVGRVDLSRDYFARRRGPRLVISASEERAAFERSLPASPPDAVHVLAAGHFLHQQEPERVNRLMRQWLAELGGPSE